MVERFPDPADQAAVIVEGRRGMPAFGTRLSADELAAVVEFTRTRLGT
jgi:mono/diheme cytochrome c family protein